MKALSSSVLGFVALLLPAHLSSAATLTGLWEFDNSGNLGQATVGTDLAVVGTAPTFNASLPDDYSTPLSGVVTTVGGSASGFTATHGVAANGGGTYVNEFSIVTDIFSPAGSRSSWRTILQTNAANSNDGDYFIRNDTDRLGTGSMTYSTTAIDEAKWTRLVITFDLNTPATSTVIKTYLDGILVYTHTGTSGELALDNRYSLYPSNDPTNPIVHFFRDNDGDNASMNVGTLAIYDGILSDSDVAALGGAGAVIPIPEPATALLGLLGLSLGLRRRR